mmetsp:Transcript_41982/g.105548  ORF Transcript_41982/g.105548 Transcript_41982/m.105548 type:complete len:328 (-) Transcript_41982:893-1876(-)
MQGGDLTDCLILHPPPRIELLRQPLHRKDLLRRALPDLIDLAELPRADEAHSVEIFHAQGSRCLRGNCGEATSRGGGNSVQRPCERCSLASCCQEERGEAQGGGPKVLLLPGSWHGAAGARARRGGRSSQRQPRWGPWSERCRVARQGVFLLRPAAPATPPGDHADVVDQKAKEPGQCRLPVVEHPPSPDQLQSTPSRNPGQAEAQAWACTRSHRKPTTHVAPSGATALERRQRRWRVERGRLQRHHLLLQQEGDHHQAKHRGELQRPEAADEPGETRRRHRMPGAVHELRKVGKQQRPAEHQRSEQRPRRWNGRWGWGWRWLRWLR